MKEINFLTHQIGGTLKKKEKKEKKKEIMCHESELYLSNPFPWCKDIQKLISLFLTTDPFYFVLGMQFPTIKFPNFFANTKTASPSY